MRRTLILAAIAIVALLALTQLLLPPYLEHRVEKRLTKQGGSAQVELSAFPALRLAFGEGSSARVRARGISIPVSSTGGSVLDGLDGFNRVDIQVTDLNAGPLRVHSFALERRGGAPYRATIAATVTASDLSAFAGGAFGGGIGALFGGIAGGSLPFGNTPVPIDLDASIASDHGRPRTESVAGSIGGLPAGPLVAALAAAVGARF
jgi:hypothetical protein